MIPSRTQIRALILFIALGVILSLARAVTTSASGVQQSGIVSETLQSVWWTIFYGYWLVVAIDLILCLRIPDLKVKRELPRNLAVGVAATIRLEIENSHHRLLKVMLTDSCPDQISAVGIPCDLMLPGKSTQIIQYQATPHARGDARFAHTYLRIQSYLSLWQKKQTVHHHQETRIYPNFAMISYLSKLGIEQELARIGIHLRQRRGEGSDFHQLREFRQGDSLKQVDWKTTARYRKPICKEFRDERDQNIVFLLDCGRQLRNKENELSHFDHALNALLVTAHIALRQGDAVGLMSFAGEPRWLSPRKGQSAVNALMNQIYDLNSTTSTSDYLDAAERLVSRYRKRSLIILITHVQEDSQTDLQAALSILRKSHTVLVANLRHSFVEPAITNTIKTHDEALSYSESINYLVRRERVMHELRAKGIPLTDSKPEHLHIGLVNEYLRLKRAGII